MLPSQSPRPKGRRSRVAKKGKTPSRRLLIGGSVGAIGLVLVVWLIAAMASGSGDETALPETADADWPPAMAAVTSPRTVDGESVRMPSQPQPQPKDEDAADDPGDPGDAGDAGDAGDSPVPANEAPEETTASSEPTRTPTTPDNAAPRRPALVDTQVARATQLLETGHHVEARLILSRALRRGTIPTAEREGVRRQLEDINSHLVFGPLVVPGDPFSRDYQIKGGDSLAKITKNLGLLVEWRFLKRVNGIIDENRIREGQRIKVVTGPFHAIVDKSEYRMDLYMGEDDDAVFVRSFPVGLGQFNATPEGMFRVRADSKLINPEWTNPRTGERFGADDPGNPIGERWIGLEGTDERTRGLTGYGIHGTIEPDSIGRQASMGCVRMRSDDVAIIYEVLIPDLSTIQIVPGG